MSVLRWWPVALAALCVALIPLSTMPMQNSFNSASVHDQVTRQMRRGGAGSGAGAGSAQNEAPSAEQVIARFHQLDTDRDGFLSLTNAIRPEMRDQITPEQIEQLMQLIDTTQDGRVSSDEFVAYLRSSVQPTSDPRQMDAFRGMFMQADADGNGMLDAEELVSLVAQRAQEQGREISLKQAKQSLAVGDADGDGFLSFEEFVQLIQNGRRQTSVVEPPPPPQEEADAEQAGEAAAE